MPARNLRQLCTASAIALVTGLIGGAFAEAKTTVGAWLNGAQDPILATDGRVIPTSQATSFEYLGRSSDTYPNTGSQQLAWWCYNQDGHMVDCPQ
jgi:hypothetical protein